MAEQGTAMARRECSVRWTAVEGFTVRMRSGDWVHGEPETEMVERLPGDVTLTREEFAAVRELCLRVREWSRGGYQTGYWPHLGPIANAYEGLPPSLREAAKGEGT